MRKSFKACSGFSVLFVFGVFVVILVGCVSSGEIGTETLQSFEQVEKLESLTPTWDNHNKDGSHDIRIYLQSYQQEAYMQGSLLYFTDSVDGRVRIYEYPTRGDSESFMVSGIGQCVAEQSSESYLEYLNHLVSTKNLVDELVMAALAKEILGNNYDRKCLQSKIKNLKLVFENDNPLDLQELPATIIDGVYYLWRSYT
ncbi:MAG: hypothetical protein JEZ06_03185 [Anaerolineaceae bacterium]|nr:hypothetical protein [Anaerolineaceae bacterium]